jgi:hypothetical protein
VVVALELLADKELTRQLAIALDGVMAEVMEMDWVGEKVMEMVLLKA